MENQGMKTGLGIARIVIAVIGVILCGLIISNADSEMPVGEAMVVQGGNLDGALWITYILVVLCAAAAVVYGLVNVIRNPKGNMGSVLGVVGMVVVFLIAYYGIADGSVTDKQAAEGVTSSISLMTGAGLMVLYVVTIITLVTVVWAEVSRIFK